jgi:hypothetical protein
MQKYPEKLVNARTAGVLYLVLVVVGLFSEATLRGRLVEPEDAAATASNVLGSEGLFRAVVAANIVSNLCEVALTVILYLLFRPVSGAVSLLAAAFRLVLLPIFALNLLNLVAALLILRGDVRVSGAEALALLFLRLQHYGYAIGLVFFGMNCLAMGYLLMRSSHVATALGVLLGVAGLGYIANSSLHLLIPGYGGAATVALLAPAFVAEVWFCLSLLVKGGGAEEWAEPVRPLTVGRGSGSTASEVKG